MFAETLLDLTQRLAKAGGWSSVPGIPDSTHWTAQTFEIFDHEGPAPLSADEVLQCILPQYRAAAVQAMERAEAGEPTDQEVEVLTAKGRHKWLRVISEPAKDADGKVLRISGAVMDISDQKRQEHAQRVLSERLFTTFECMTDAFYMLDKQWRLMYINEAAERLTGRDRVHDIGKSLWEVNPALVATPLYRGFRAAMDTGEPFHLEYYSEVMHIWIELDAYPSPEGLAVFFHSITEKRAMADRIAASEQRLKHVTQATLDAAWDWNLETNEIWWSGRLERLFAWSQAKVQHELQTDNRYWLERVHPDDRMRVINDLENHIKCAAEVWEGRYRLLRENGEYAHVEHRASIVRRADGLATHVVGGITDITNRIEMERRVLESQRLESVGKLTGHVAHDFNNLLTVILGNAELLQGYLGQQPALVELATTISKSVLKGSDLTRRLLAFAGRQNLDPRPLDVNQLVSGMRPLLQRTLGVDIDVRLHQHQDLATALADANQLEGALLNLCLNARDAMPDGGTLLIETAGLRIDEGFPGPKHELRPGSYIVVSVTDSGTGIPPEVLQHVFEPFFTTKPVGKGTGLGLSSVFGFARQSNGSVSLYSEPGHGTTVRLYLPVSAGVAEQLPQRELPISGGNERILVVDDDELVLVVAEGLLARSLGYEVEVCTDAQAALQLLETGKHFDLVFTDVMMPGMNGRDFARQLRARWPRQRILFTSGFTENALALDGGVDGGVYFLPKPYPLNELARKVREVLDADG